MGTIQIFFLKWVSYSDQLSCAPTFTRLSNSTLQCSDPAFWMRKLLSQKKPSVSGKPVGQRMRRAHCQGHHSCKGQAALVAAGVTPAGYRGVCSRQEGACHTHLEKHGYAARFSSNCRPLVPFQPMTMLNLTQCL